MPDCTSVQGKAAEGRQAAANVDARGSETSMGIAIVQRGLGCAKVDRRHTAGPIHQSITSKYVLQCNNI